MVAIRQQADAGRVMKGPMSETISALLQAKGGKYGPVSDRAEGEDNREPWHCTDLGHQKG